MGRIEWTELGQGRNLHEIIRAFRTEYLLNAGEVSVVKWDGSASGLGRVYGEFTLENDPTIYDVSCDYHDIWRIRWTPK